MNITFMFGDQQLLTRPRRAILISRTPRNPAPGTPWVRAIVEAVRRSVDAGEVIVTGIGRDPYELALVECKRAGGEAIIVLEQAVANEEQWRLLKDISPERRLLVHPRGQPGTFSVSPSERDQWIGKIADRAWSVSIRPKGNMAAVAELLKERGFPIDQVSMASAIRDSGNPTSRPLPISTAVAENPWTFLTHYTREPDGAWPDESRLHYLTWLAAAPVHSRRDASEALRKMLATQCIIGSGRLMPGHTPMVSFTAKPPWEMADLFRWRTGLHRWTFRPYGLAVSRTVLAEMRARPVTYLAESAIRQLSDSERAFTQKHEPPGTDWSAEMEWRLPGDFRFDSVPRDCLRILVPRSSESTGYQDLFQITAYTICE